MFCSASSFDQDMCWDLRDGLSPPRSSILQGPIGSLYTVSDDGTASCECAYGQTLDEDVGNNGECQDIRPTGEPTSEPTIPTSEPSGAPSGQPTGEPTSVPSVIYALDTSSNLLAGSPWPSLGRSAFRHGTSPFYGPATPSDASVKWTFSVTDTDAIQSSPVVGPDDVVYVGSDGDHLDAVSKSGTIVWSFDCLTNLRAAPVLTQTGKVVIGSRTGIWAVDQSTGELDWSLDFEGDVLSSPTVDGSGNLFFGANDEKLHKVSSSGVLQWSCTLGDVVAESSPALSTSDNVVVIGASDGVLYAADTSASDCSSFLWTYTTGGAIRSTPLIDDFGSVFVASRDGKVHAVSLSSGSALWTYTSITNADFDASPAIDRHGLFVYAADMDGRLYALAARDHPSESRVAGDEYLNQVVHAFTDVDLKIGESSTCSCGASEC